MDNKKVYFYAMQKPVGPARPLGKGSGLRETMGLHVEMLIMAPL